MIDLKSKLDPKLLRLKIETREDKKNFEIYNFKDSGDGKSWLLGDESSTFANAYIEGHSNCPKDIIVPRSLTKEGVTKPVEVIGQYAYSYCGQQSYGSETKTVIVTKQVRIIKYFGFGSMHHLESFRIEEGSVLETIAWYGLYAIGYTTGINDETKRGTLILPSTLSSVAADGIRQCNLFKIIIYCGTYSLTKSCELESSSIYEMTKVKVTNQYSTSIIFGRTALKDSPTEIEEECNNFAKSIPSPSQSLSPTPSEHFSSPYSCNYHLFITSFLAISLMRGSKPSSK